MQTIKIHTFTWPSGNKISVLSDFAKIYKPEILRTLPVGEKRYFGPFYVLFFPATKSIKLIHWSETEKHHIHFSIEDHTLLDSFDGHVIRHFRESYNEKQFVCEIEKMNNMRFFVVGFLSD